MNQECGSCEYMGVDEAGHATCYCLVKLPDWCPLKEEPPIDGLRRGKMADLNMGDRVTYKGEDWEVGFINQRSFRGTLRLQKSGMSDARQINRVYPEEVIKIVSHKEG